MGGALLGISGAAGVGADAVVVAPNAAFDFATGDMIEIEGWIQIRAAGAVGTFDSYTRVTTNNTPATNNDSEWVFDVATTDDIDTTVAQDLTVTSTWSVGDETSTLREFWAEVWPE